MPIVATVLVAVLVAGLAGVLVAVFVAVLAALLAAVMVAVAPVTVTRSVSILATSCRFQRFWRPYVGLVCFWVLNRYSSSIIFQARWSHPALPSAGALGLASANVGTQPSSGP